MKRLAFFCMMLIGVSLTADAAVPQQRRGGGAATAATSASTRSVATSTRSATAARSATSTRSAATPAASARSATTGRTTVNRGATSTASGTSSSAARSAVVSRAAATQKVIGTGTKVAAATENVIVSEECRQKYMGCMDSFCMLDNDSGGRCICSDRNAELDDILAQIEELDQRSYQMATYGVERIEMGDSADAVIANANAVAQSIIDESNDDENDRALNLTLWSNPDYLYDTEEEDIFADSEFVDPIEGKEGDALYAAAADICSAQVPECANELSMLQLMYQQQIRSDCTAYENSLKQQKNSSAQKLYAAETALRDAALEQYQTANKYDLGQCTVEFKNCMQTTGGCGDDFAGCASIAAFDATNTRGNRADDNTYEIQGTVTSIAIQKSTYDILLSKKPLCESVTKQCVAVADQVWDTFLREVAPQVKSAELIAEDNARQNCVANISTCFQQACRDNIDPSDPDGSYDMCLTRPETMLNLCQVPLNACGISTESADAAQESQIWEFVHARLQAMRVNQCAVQVKECLQDQNRCGPDYAQCIGLDLDSISAMCPIEVLTACHGENGDSEVTKMADLDDIILGIYLSIDNALLDQCQKAVNEKMIEICGDTQNCTAFANDTVMGTESLLSYTNSEGNYVIDGLISFGNVEVNKITKESENNSGGSYSTYEIDIGNYQDHLNDTDPSAARVVSALESVANKIEQKIAILRQDPDIQMCVEGRNLTQVRRNTSENTTRNTSENTTSRFPYLLDSSIMTIISGGLDQARQNYNRKYDELVESALEMQNDQIKSVLCAAMTSSGEPQCTSYVTVNAWYTDGEAVCNKYEAPKIEAVFGNTTDSGDKIGISGNNLYSTKYVIPGADMSELAAVMQSGHSEYTQVDSMGNMIGKIAMSSVYSAENNTCTITTTTTMCKSMDAVILTNTEAKRGIMGMFFGIGRKKTETTQSYAGNVCTEFADPVTTTNTVKM